MDCLREEYSQIIRDMIKHENDLISSRMGWMMTLQGFMFAAFGVAIQSSAYKPFIFMIPIVGMVISVLTIWGIWSAAYAIDKLQIWWNQNGESEYLGPPVIGATNKCRMLRYITPWLIIPLVCLIAWLFVYINLQN